MKTGFRYIVDEKDNKIAVIIPYAFWEKLNKDREKLKSTIAVLTGKKKV